MWLLECWVFSSLAFSQFHSILHSTALSFRFLLPFLISFSHHLNTEQGDRMRGDVWEINVKSEKHGVFLLSSSSIFSHTFSLYILLLQLRLFNPQYVLFLYHYQSITLISPVFRNSKPILKMEFWGFSGFSLDFWVTYFNVKFGVWM